MWKGVRDKYVGPVLHLHPTNPEPYPPNSCTWKTPYWVLPSCLTSLVVLLGIRGTETTVAIVHSQDAGRHYEQCSHTFIVYIPGQSIPVYHPRLWCSLTITSIFLHFLSLIILPPSSLSLSAISMYACCTSSLWLQVRPFCPTYFAVSVPPRCSLLAMSS